MFAVVDLETTGSHPESDRIIEIAICVHDGNSVTREFATLVNPGVRIPPFISRLTRITDEMVRSAPDFSDIAGEVAEILSGNIFVAHNVTFDYGFLRHALQREGHAYENHLLCTCKTSRKLLPGHPSYSLPRLCRSLDIKHTDAHRAAADARATATILGMLFDKAAGKLEPYFHVQEKRINHTRIPDEMLEKLPRKAGVLYLYNERGEVIFIAKAHNIRKKALSLVSRMKSRRFAALAAHAVAADAEVTGNDLMASINEITDLLKLQPRWNRKISGLERRMSVVEHLDPSGNPEFAVEPYGSDSIPIVTLNSAREAQALILELHDRYGLPETHRIPPGNLEAAHEWLRSKRRNFIITLSGPEPGSLSYVVVKNGTFAGTVTSGNEEPHMAVETVLENLHRGLDHPVIFSQIIRHVGQGKLLGMREF
jgi:DNA polymerase-3 subunit epsilon